MIDVTCAIMRNEENEILVVQRGEKSDHPFKWEFPGGKIAQDESPESCIIREIDEELSMNIVICGKLDPVEYDYGHKQVRLYPFICDTIDELPFLSEHLAYRWIKDKDFKSVDFCEADLLVASDFLDSFGNMEIHEAQTKNLLSQESVDDAGLQEMVNQIMGMKEAEWVAASAIDNPVIFRRLIEFSFSPDKKLAFRASWTLTKVCDRFPELITPYISQIIEALNNLENESAERSFLRIISMSDLSRFSSKHQGILADHCFTALKSGFSAIAIKAYSMEILYRLSLIYPDLALELAASIKIILEDSTAGITSRGRTILKKLGEILLKDKR